MTKTISTGDYQWEVGRFEVDGPYGPMPTTYLIGKAVPVKTTIQYQPSTLKQEPITA